MRGATVVMINFHHVVKDINILKDFLWSLEIQSYAKEAKSIFVQVFCSHAEQAWIESINKSIKEAFPTAVFVGSTTAGEIAEGRLLIGTTVLSISFFETALVKPIAISCLKGNELTSGKQLGKAINESGSDIAGVLILATPLSIDVANLFNGMPQNGNDYPIFGGGAGVYSLDNSIINSSMIFCGNNFYEHGVIAVVFLGNDLHISLNSCLGWQPLSKEMTITETDGRLVKKIDGVRAFEIYKRYLKIKNDNSFFLNVLEFPFLLERNGKIIARVPHFVDQDGNIEFIADLNVGEKFRIGYGDPEIIVQNAEFMEKAMNDFEPDVIFLFNCVCHRFLMQNDVELEIQRFNDISPTVGFYTYSEFSGDNNKIQSLNSTMIVVGMREGEKRINSRLSDEPKIDNADKSVIVDPYAIRHNRIISRLVHFISVVTSELEQANDELTKLAEIDKVTQIYNRLKIEDIFEYEFKKCGRYNVDFSIIMMDVDRFKQINDFNGHYVGDDVLFQIVNIIRENVRETDYVGRWGGDEFLIILPHTNIKEASTVAERIRSSVSLWEFPTLNNQTCSFGVASYTLGDNQDKLLVRADEALYEAKNNGRNSVVLKF
ncbi:diguanylate cyclase (GGDEF)-like protein [Sedimentibacter acidaminivorans]|uniref:Diguanylate cyclase (GGDEF)-like protein n=1 Tax=Sedimentibacter acidaminivorans TaxID=913099 RepID=A0ABS4GCH2_9FIRM|nr:GGDEF domain-containing protein [Sedimentibacter acidaminivorans]MBP1925371.1 diguanylate cyclase (GGDEF)-like protein [Sedimentibacter acidaminivorans]